MTTWKYRALLSAFTVAIVALTGSALHRCYRERHPNTFLCEQDAPRICKLHDDHRTNDTFEQDTAYCRWVNPTRNEERLRCTATITDCQGLGAPVEPCRHYTPAQMPDSTFRSRLSQ